MSQIEKLALLGLAVLVAGFAGLTAGVVMGFMSARFELSIALIIASSIFVASGGIILALAQLTNELIGWRENQRVPTLINPSAQSAQNFVKTSLTPPVPEVSNVEEAKSTLNTHNNHALAANKNNAAENENSNKNSNLDQNTALKNPPPSTALAAPEGAAKSLEKSLEVQPQLQQKTPQSAHVLNETEASIGSNRKEISHVEDGKLEASRARPVLPLVGAAATAAVIASQMGNRISHANEPPVAHDEIASSLEALLEKAGLSENEKNIHRQSQIFKDTGSLSRDVTTTPVSENHDETRNFAPDHGDSIREVPVEESAISAHTMERLISEALSGEVLEGEKFAADTLIEHALLVDNAPRVDHHSSSIFESAQQVDQAVHHGALNDQTNLELPVADFDMDMMLARLVLPHTGEQESGIDHILDHNVSDEAEHKSRAYAANDVEQSFLNPDINADMQVLTQNLSSINDLSAVHEEALQSAQGNALDVELAAILETSFMTQEHEKHVTMLEDTRIEANVPSTDTPLDYVTHNESEAPNAEMSLEAFIEAQLKDLNEFSPPVASAWEGQAPYNTTYDAELMSAIATDGVAIENLSELQTNDLQTDVQNNSQAILHTQEILHTVEQEHIKEPAPETMHNELLTENTAHSSDPTLAPVSALAPQELGGDVVGRYSVGDHDYVMFSDGSIEANTSEGQFRFSSMDDLKSFIDELSQRQLSNDDQSQMPQAAAI